MTELLRKAVATLSELPPEEQDALAAMVLEELACGQVPDRPPLSIEALEEEARLEHRAGRIWRRMSSSGSAREVAQLRREVRLAGEAAVDFPGLLVPSPWARPEIG